MKREHLYTLMGGPYDGQNHNSKNHWADEVFLYEKTTLGRLILHCYVVSNIVREGRRFYLFKETSKL